MYNYSVYIYIYMYTFLSKFVRQQYVLATKIGFLYL